MKKAGYDDLQLIWGGERRWQENESSEKLARQP